MKRRFRVEIKCSLPVTVSKTILADTEEEAKQQFRDCCLNWPDIQPRCLPDVSPDDYPNRADFEANEMDIETDEMENGS